MPFPQLLLEKLILDLHLLFLGKLLDSGRNLEGVAYIDGEHPIKESDDKAE
jgi:hypothetical protein